MRSSSRRPVLITLIVALHTRQVGDSCCHCEDDAAKDAVKPQRIAFIATHHDPKPQASLTPDRVLPKPVFELPAAAFGLLPILQ